MSFNYRKINCVPLNAIAGFIKIAVISPRYVNIQAMVKIIKTQTILVVAITANISFEKIIPSKRNNT